MDLVELIAKVRSGVVKLSIERDREVIAHGTGFLVKDGLVTCSHCLPEGGYDAVAIHLDDDSKGNDIVPIRYEAHDVASWVVARSVKTENDYVFFTCSEKEFEDRHRFEFTESSLLSVGTQVAFLGFPFGVGHLTSHVGYVSSLYKDNGVTVLRIDGSINKGNSGGPVLDLSSGRVVGLITRSETGLIEVAFDQLINSFKNNQDTLGQISKSGSTIKLGGFDPIQGATVTQAQLMKLAEQIRRSANVGIGIAFSTDALANKLSQKSGG